MGGQNLSTRARGDQDFLGSKIRGPGFFKRGDQNLYVKEEVYPFIEGGSIFFSVGKGGTSIFFIGNQDFFMHAKRGPK